MRANKKIGYSLVIFFLSLSVGTLVSCGKKTEGKGESTTEEGPQRARKWQQIPIDLKISKSFAEEEREAIFDMVDVWENAAQKSFFAIDPVFVPNKVESDLFAYLDDDEMGIYKSEDWFSDQSKSILAATVYKGFIHNEGKENEFLEMVHADIVFNYKDHKFKTSSFKVQFRYDFPTVLLHELGHFIGLNHRGQTEKSVMVPKTSMFDVEREAYDLDRDELASLYEDSGKYEMGKSAMSKSVAPRPVRGVVFLKDDGTEIHHEENLP